jgi:hypothetical protein
MSYFLSLVALLGFGCVPGREEFRKPLNFDFDSKPALEDRVIESEASVAGTNGDARDSSKITKRIFDEMMADRIKARYFGKEVSYYSLLAHSQQYKGQKVKFVWEGHSEVIQDLRTAVFRETGRKQGIKFPVLSFALSDRVRKEANFIGFLGMDTGKYECSRCLPFGDVYEGVMEISKKYMAGAKENPEITLYGTFTFDSVNDDSGKCYMVLEALETPDYFVFSAIPDFEDRHCVVVPKIER